LIQVKDIPVARRQSIECCNGPFIMIVCSCHVVTEREVRDAIEALSSPTMSQVYRELDHKPQCGRCTHTVRRIMSETQTGR
jgi:bacterioferritin-associated ferredoxin